MTRFGTAAPVAAGDVPRLDPPRGWTVIVPVRPAAADKPLLRQAGTDGAGLLRAMALDTIAAAAAAEEVTRVIVVTGDREIAAAVRPLPKVSTVDEGGAQGPEQAVALGAVEAGAECARAALVADLPALRSEELDAALRAAASLERAVVADAEGTGSTLVTARAGATWLFAFGEDSFARHRLLGCTALDVPLESSLRRDVDTAEQLADAAALGLNAHTAAALAPPRVSR